MSQDSLQLVAVEKWPELQSVLLADWPRSLPGYNVLETQKIWKQAGLDYGFQVYSPFGDVKNGFIAVNEKDSSYDIIIQYPKDDTKILENALRTTNIIDWNRKDKVLKLPFCPQHAISCVEKVVQNKNVKVRVQPLDQMYTYIKEKSSSLHKSVCLPLGFTFEVLSLDHLELINTKWPHYHPTSHIYFKLLLDSKSGYGLFKDGEVVAWLLIGECGNLTHLYTLEEHRKRGYAELVLKLVCNAILEERKRDIFAFCVKTNVNASKLYEKLGFKKAVDVSWPDVF